MSPASMAPDGASSITCTTRFPAGSSTIFMTRASRQASVDKDPSTITKCSVLTPKTLPPSFIAYGKPTRKNTSKIRDVIRLATPFFDDFKLRPIPTNSEIIQLEWQQKDSDYPFRAHQLSDGTLRFMCLATALLQPLRPATMLFDEPELGLHPYALTLLGNLFKQAAEAYGSSVRKQVIISTQSAALLSEFAPEDVIIVERHNGESTFQRLDAATLSEWLTEYSLGELWQKNLLGGRPRAEDTPHLVPNGDK